MKGWNGNWSMLDQSIIVYSVGSGKVNGGSNPNRTVKQVQEDCFGYKPGGDVTMELDSSTRSLVMWINNEKIRLDGKIGDFQYSPIIIFRGFSWPYGPYEVTLL